MLAWNEIETSEISAISYKKKKNLVYIHTCGGVSYKDACV